ncbi:MAG TPA: Gfo/Idh/MocA family oxidoreductase [Tepidisphaeraceae bacterium]|nr:Gfo/Idh/MocA family oxidoreductase [Tepidisphaeraceae bacterium]
MKISIIGCGVIGNKRAKALGDHALLACADANLSRAQAVSVQHPGCIATADWRLAATREDVDAVIVSTTNDVLAAATLAAVQAGKHVLVEKPGARNADELAPVIEAAALAKVVVKVGFNHRFHPALQKAREIIDAGTLGPVMFLRARYGHGGRLGMEREWRGNADISGGGEMLDQGVHLIDLSRWFVGEFTQVTGHVATFFWDWSVEDNGFAMLRTKAGQVAWLHASCTEWKNTFSMEIYGRVGKIHIEGLGGSYGVERLTLHKMLPEMGPPQTTIWEYPGEDQSWQAEFDHFAQCIKTGATPSGSLQDAVAALDVVGKLYAQTA